MTSIHICHKTYVCFRKVEHYLMIMRKIADFWQLTRKTWSCENFSIKCGMLSDCQLKGANRVLQMKRYSQLTCGREETCQKIQVEGEKACVILPKHYLKYKKEPILLDIDKNCPHSTVVKRERSFAKKCHSLSHLFSVQCFHRNNSIDLRSMNVINLQWIGLLDMQSYFWRQQGPVPVVYKW